MSAPKRPPLDLIQDMTFQRREWVVQRIGWVVMALVLIAAILGLFGYGVLSTAKASDPSGKLDVQYERFGRIDAAADLQVRIDRSLFEGDRVELWIDRSFIDAQQIDSITPEPIEVEPGELRCTFVFPAPRGDDRAYIVFHLAPQKAGKYYGQVGVPQGQSVMVRHFVYP